MHLGFVHLALAFVHLALAFVQLFVHLALAFVHFAVVQLFVRLAFAYLVWANSPPSSLSLGQHERVGLPKLQKELVPMQQCQVCHSSHRFSPLFVWSFVCVCV